MTPIERARSVIGAPYRRQGREPRTGIDCLGLAFHCFDLSFDMRTSDGRGLSPTAFERLAIRYFTTANTPRDGDLVVMRERGRWHLGIRDGEAMIHADARSRRVVRRPGRLPMKLYAVLRRRGEMDNGNARPADSR